MQNIYQVIGFLVVITVVLALMLFLTAGTSYTIKKIGIKKLLLIPVKLTVAVLIFIPYQIEKRLHG